MNDPHARRLRRRYAKERWLGYGGVLCILLAVLFLGGLLGNVAWQGWRGFTHAEVRLEVALPASVIGTDGQASPRKYQRLIKKALLSRFPVTTRDDKKRAQKIIGLGGALALRAQVLRTPDLIGGHITLWLPAGGNADSYLKGATPANTLRQLGASAAHLARLDALLESGAARTAINWRFFTAADSSNPDMAGIGGALRGSLFTLLLTFAFSFPTAVMAAAYLEMFAPRNWWFDLVEISINNLAAVPSVIFGLLGLAIFINLFGVPRSSPLVGALVLSLMTLPTIIIAARTALRAVPPSLLAGAMSLGATRMQGVLHHVLPAAMPGVLTGTIIGMAQALGETAPLLLIGMVAFVNDAPSGVLEPATALPVQIFLWADNPLRGFAERAATAILVLLGFLALMNAAAVILRKRMEVKW